MSRRDADPAQDSARSSSLFDAPGPTCAALRKIDWADTVLGPPETWPADLRRAAHTVVRAAAPMLVWWGDQFVQVHNDAMIASLRDDEPAVARPAEQCWPERWVVLAPHARRVVETGDRHTVDEIVLPVDGAPSTVWTMSLAPLRDGDTGAAGVLVNAVDRTARDTAREGDRRGADATIAHLQVALATNRRIGTAIGILMAHRRITDTAAFELLRDASQRGHRKLREIADDVVLTGTLPD
jgi:hypothetical protein